MASPFTIWGALGSFFGGLGVHWDRSTAGKSFFALYPIWVDTGTAASGYAVGSSLSYNVMVSAQDDLGNEGAPLLVATTTMVFPFVSSSGVSGAAAGSVLFSESFTDERLIENGGVIWWSATATPGTYNVYLKTLTDVVPSIAQGGQAITFGSTAILEAAVTNPESCSFASNQSGFLLGYATGTAASHSIFLQGFDTEGGTTTVRLGVATNTSSSWETQSDANGVLWFIEENNTDPNDATLDFRTFSPTQGYGAVQSLATGLTDLTAFDVEFSYGSDGSRMVWAQGTSSGGANYLIADAVNSSLVLLGSGATIALNATGPIHVALIASPITATGEYVLVYADATTPGGSTFQVHLRLFDGNGNEIGTDQVVGGLQGFDHVRLLDGGLVEIDYRQATGAPNGSNVVGIVYDTETMGATINESGDNNLIAGTAFNDTINAGKGNDIIAGGPGINTIDGGGGFDIATYAVASSAASIVHNANNTWTVYIPAILESDTLSSVEELRFTDRTIALRQQTRADINGDGASEIPWFDAATGDFGYWGVDVTGAHWNYVAAASTTVKAVGMGDMNGDGTTDVVWQNPGNNLVGTWLISGGTPTWKVIDVGSTTMQIAGLGDFNADGNTDVLWQNPTNNLVGEWEMHDAVDTWHLIDQGSTTMQIAGLGDFNGDGTSDVLWQNPTNNLIGYWAMNGSVDTWHLIDQGSTTMQIAGIGDFNGDGTSDILWRNNANGLVGYWAMNNGVDSWHVIDNSSTAFQVAGVGDYNGDGTSDILWRNPASGEVGVWAMNNGQDTWFDLGASSTAFNVVKS